LSGPDPIARREAQGLSKVCDRARPKILEAQQRFVGCFANLADGFQARSYEHVLDPCRKSNAINRRIVRQLRRRIDQMSFAHFPFAFSQPSNLINRAHYGAGFYRSAIHHPDLG
jgi:hypothetical protein